MILSILGFVVGQVLLPFGGQNEFMSAVVAAKVMEIFLTTKHLFQITACIEASIPFQPISEDGLSGTNVSIKNLKKQILN